MNQRRFTFRIEGIDEPFRVLAFEGEEGISELFSFRLTLGGEDAAIPLASAIGKPACLTMFVEEEPRYVHGIVSRFEQTEKGRHLAYYQATLVPRAYRLVHRKDCRIFQNLPVPKIIESVFHAAGFGPDEYRFSLYRKYEPKEYSVQYRETDWSFVCRLMEEEGIFCFFEQTEHGHVLIIGDTGFVNAPIPAPDVIRYSSTKGLVASTHVSTFRYAEEMRPGKVTMRDYNFSLPNLQLEVTAEAARDKDLEIYDYPGEYALPTTGKERASVRLEDVQALRETGRGEGTCVRFSPGYVFSLVEHHNEAYNREYLLLRVEHRGVEPEQREAPDADPSAQEGYANRFLVIPSRTPFRPTERAPKPSIRGVQTAVVVGPKGEEIYTDEFGRVKVQFHWDRQGKHDERSSCWVRVAQIWAGSAFGGLHIPRIGHEVIVDFLEGDPDRPIIVGSVYHTTNITPYPLPGEKAKSTMKSQSYPGGGGSNELRFDDRKGEEEVYLHGQKDLAIVVEHDKDQTIGRNEKLNVGNDRDKRVDGNQREIVAYNKTILVGQNHEERIAGDEAVTVDLSSVRKIGTTLTVDVGSDQAVTVGGNAREKVDGNVDVAIAQNANESVKGDKNLGVEGKYDVSVMGDMSVVVSSKFVEQVDDEKSTDVVNKITLKSGMSVITVKKDGTIVIEGKDLKIEASGEVKIEGNTKLSVKASGPVNLDSAGPVKIKGSTIDLN